MDRILEEFSATVVVKAIEANVNAQFPLIFAALPQIEIHDEPDISWVISGIQDIYLNCVLRAELAPVDVHGRIEGTLAHFRSRGVPMRWRVGPSTRPTDLGRHLLAHGLTHGGDTTGMAVDLLALNEAVAKPSGLTIEQVGDVDALHKWTHAVAVSFEHPESVADALFDAHAGPGFSEQLPWRLYIGLLDGEPVAAARLFLAVGVAGISHVATIPGARRQGIGTAMTLAALREARSMGYRIGVLHAAPGGLHVYRRLGFEEYCKLRLYLCTGEAHGRLPEPARSRVGYERVG
jgi:GNAT superfamily N-acetyltransferase